MLHLVGNKCYIFENIYFYFIFKKNIFFFTIKVLFKKAPSLYYCMGQGNPTFLSINFIY